MGYLESYSYSKEAFSLLHAVAGPVRDFTWNSERKLLFVNQGMHGVAVYGYSDNGFSKLGGVQGPSAVKQMAVSLCGAHLGFSSQSTSTATVAVFAATSTEAAYNDVHRSMRRRRGVKKLSRRIAPVKTGILIEHLVNI